MIKVSCPLVTTCRQRGAIRGLITSIQKRVTEFETLAEATDLSDVDCLTIQHIVQNLEKSDTSFKELHLGVLDLIDEAEQEMNRPYSMNTTTSSLMPPLLFSNS